MMIKNKVGVKSKAEAREAVKAFGLAETLGLDAYRLMEKIVVLAKRYHSIQEHDCNGTKTPTMATLETNLEKRIMGLAQSLGLKVRFDGDPRGFCVKLFGKPETWNTWGGSENGYGVGAK